MDLRLQGLLHLLELYFWEEFLGVVELSDVELDAIVVIELVYRPFFGLLLKIGNQLVAVVAMEGYDDCSVLIKEQVPLNQANKKGNAQLLMHLLAFFEPLVFYDGASHGQQHSHQFEICLDRSIFPHDLAHDRVRPCQKFQQFIIFGAGTKVMVCLFKIDGKVEKAFITLETHSPLIVIDLLQLRSHPNSKLAVGSEGQLFPNIADE